MRRRIISLSLFAFLGLGTLVFAQVTGVVNDADNCPEADVEVNVKGTNRVVYTDADGKFDIDAKIGYILVVNGKEFNVTSNTLGVLKYTAKESLSEVVVKNIFNAPSKSGVTTVKAKDLEAMNPSVFIDQMIGGKVAGLSSQAHTEQEIATLSKNNHNWSDDLYKNGITSSHFISISKNDGESSNNFSVGYDKNEGAVKYYDGLERITATFNNTTKVKDWLRYGINVNGSYTTLDSPRDRVNAQSPFFNTLLNRPYETFYSLDENGNAILEADGNKVYNPNTNYMGYPVADEMEKIDTQTRYLRIYGTGFRRS